MKPIQAIILSAGLGRRLYPYTKDRPKCLVKIHGLPILHYQLSALENQGITDIVLVVGFKKELVKAYLRKHFTQMHFSFIYIKDYATTNTLYSLAVTLTTLDSNKSVLIINGDVLVEKHVLAETIPSFSKSLALVRKGPTIREDVKVTVDSSFHIQSINKKILAQKAYGEAVGIYLLNKSFRQHLTEILAKLKHTNAMDFYEFAFEKIISPVFPLQAVEVDKEFVFEIDTPLDLKRAEAIKSKWML